MVSGRYQAIQAAYDALDPERSLLVRDGELSADRWWTLRKDLELGEILKLAGRPAGLSHQAPQLWLRSAREAIPTLSAQPKFHVLALVNRLDLGEWDARAQRMIDAEIRVVYGLKGAHQDDIPPMTLIVEFVFPALKWTEYRNLAVQWAYLSSCSPVQFDTCLTKTAMAQFQGNFAYTRVRVNQDFDDHDGRWNMAQWVFKPSGFSRAPLDDQMEKDCAVSSHCVEFRREWDGLAGHSAATRWPLPPALLALSRVYSPLFSPGGLPPTVGMTALDKRCGDARVRNILALQQCTFCHAGETNTEFMHVRNRKWGESRAELSKFVAGAGTVPQARVPLGSIGSQAYMAKVLVGGCGSTPITRTFYDLARRRLFLSAVLADAGPQPSKGTLLREYAPNFTH